MNQSLPVAVVAGVHRFGARKLVEELVKNDISVVGLGEYVMELDGQNGFEYGSNLGDVEKVDYVFDFEGKLETWRAAENWGSKLVVIEVNGYEGEDKSWLVSAGVDWRLVRLYGVFGEGMLQEEEKRVGVENLVPILIAAVKNKNLELPEKGSFRLLAEEDAVEVVLRSIFLSGTKGELINIWGAETKCTEIATSLVEVAKMTRKKIIDKELPERELNDKEILENWEKIRWQPKAKFGESVEKTLQYLFRVVDEENRRGKTKDQTHPASAKLSPPSLDKEGKARAGRFEVVVEQNNDQLLITNYELEDKKPKEDIRSKIYDLRIELKTENEDLRSKKYDLRIEPEEEIVEIKPMIIKSPIPERMVEQEIKEQTPLVRQGGRSHRPERYLRPLDKGDRAPGSEVAVTKKNFKWPRIKFNFNFEGKKWGWGLGIVVGTLVLGLVVGVAG
ncbi:hypothetical protein KBC75_05025, partial [Candidatus Shapirobacteria bacterium]|nr:hypothetical protein [Candidatus Shapirobacteria bacterium]